jgi:hypothetical protein
MSKKSGESLSSELDRFFLTLLKEAYPDKSPDQPVNPDAPKVSYGDRLRLFDSGVRWVQVKNKVDPEGETDEFGKARQQFAKRGARSRGADTAASAAAVNGHDG